MGCAELYIPLTTDLCKLCCKLVAHQFTKHQIYQEGHRYSRAPGPLCVAVLLSYSRGIQTGDVRGLPCPLVLAQNRSSPSLQNKYLIPVPYIVRCLGHSEGTTFFVATVLSLGHALPAFCCSPFSPFTALSQLSFLLFGTVHTISPLQHSPLYQQLFFQLCSDQLYTALWLVSVYDLALRDTIDCMWFLHPWHYCTYL